MRYQKSTERSLGKAREPSMADNCVYDQSLSTGVTITGQNFWLEALSFPGALLTGCAKAFFDFRLFPGRAGQDPADVLRLGWVTAVNWEPPTNWRVLRVFVHPRCGPRNLFSEGLSLKHCKNWCKSLSIPLPTHSYLDARPSCKWVITQVANSLIWPKSHAPNRPMRLVKLAAHSSGSHSPPNTSRPLVGS